MQPVGNLELQGAAIRVGELGVSWGPCLSRKGRDVGKEPNHRATPPRISCRYGTSTALP